VNFIIVCALDYTFQIYKCPTSLLENVDSWIRIFIWTHDINKQGLIIVKWSNLCCSEKDDEVQVMNTPMENKAYLLRLAWDSPIVPCPEPY